MLPCKICRFVTRRIIVTFRNLTLDRSRQTVLWGESWPLRGISIGMPAFRHQWCCSGWCETRRGPTRRRPQQRSDRSVPAPCRRPSDHHRQRRPQPIPRIHRRRSLPTSNVTTELEFIACVDSDDVASFLRDAVVQPAGAILARADGLMWWTNGTKLPPLVTTSPQGTPVAQAGARCRHHDPLRQ